MLFSVQGGELFRVFEHIDTNRDGHISEAEFLKFIRSTSMKVHPSSRNSLVCSRCMPSQGPLIQLIVSTAPQLRRRIYETALQTLKKENEAAMAAREVQLNATHKASTTAAVEIWAESAEQLKVANSQLADLAKGS